MSTPSALAARPARPYTANLIKAGALLPETAALLVRWNGETPEAFARLVLERQLIGRATRTRLADLLRRWFFRRYPPDGLPGLAHASTFVRELTGHAGARAVALVCLYHTAVAEPPLMDLLAALSGRPGGDAEDAAVRDLALAGRLTTRDVVRFLRVRGGAAAEAWSPATADRTASGALCALRDFGVLTGRGTNRTLPGPLSVPLPAFLYAAHALEPEATTARALVQHPNWAAFLLAPDGVERLLLQAHAAGHLGYHRTGDIRRLDWRHADLDALLVALVAEARDAAAVQSEAARHA